MPVIMLTAMGETADRITGLSAGADDYLPKPFEPLELVLRIKNILKRAPQVREEVRDKLDLGLCVYDLNKKSCIPNRGRLFTLRRSNRRCSVCWGRSQDRFLPVRSWRNCWEPGKVPAPSMFRLHACARKSKRTLKIRVICKRYAARDICCFPNSFCRFLRDSQYKSSDKCSFVILCQLILLAFILIGLISKAVLLSGENICI